MTTLVSIAQGGDLSSHKGLSDWIELRRQLQNFKSIITPSGKETWAASRGHDDLVIATAMAAWVLKGSGQPGANMYEYARRLAGAMPRDTFCLAVDFGQSVDPCALVAMSKTAFPDEAESFEPVPPMQPESTVSGEGYVGSEQWALDLDTEQKRAVVGSSPSGPLATGFVAAPRQFAYRPQRGSLEWQRVEDENMRYRRLLNGRRASPEEREEHENNLKTIREAHDAV